MPEQVVSEDDFEEYSLHSDKNPIFRSVRVRESKSSTIIDSEVMAELEPTIVDTISEEDELFKRRVAAQIVGEEVDIPTATRVLWYDESEPYFLCEGCFDNHQDKAWEGKKRHPRFIEFQYSVHSQLRDGCVCEYCREVGIQKVMGVIHSTIEVKMDGEENES